MNNLSNGDFREICDTVEESAISAVKQMLSEIQPLVIKSIGDEVTRKIENKYMERIKKLEDRTTLLEEKLANHPPVITKKSSSDNAKKAGIDVSRILSGFKYNGWIYYKNEDMANFLYKVREDGSSNTQLTDYSVSGFFSVSGDLLRFCDASLEEKKLKCDEPGGARAVIYFESCSKRCLNFHNSQTWDYIIGSKNQIFISFKGERK